MLSKILDSFVSHPSIVTVEKALADRKSADIHGLGGSSGAFFIAALFTRAVSNGSSSILVVCPGEDETVAIREDIEAVLNEENVRFFPERDVPSYEPENSHFEVRSQRVETIDALESGWRGITVAPVGALHDPTTPPGMLALISMDIRKGEALEFDYLVRSLVHKGFKRTGAVSVAGEMSVRGGIVDIFPFGGDVPYRVEFWGDEVESVRTFSTSTQRSLDEVDGFRIIPPDEYVTEAGMGARELERLMEIEDSSGIDLSRIRNSFADGDRPDGMEQYLYTVYGSQASLVSYYSPDDIVILIDPDRCRRALDKRMKRAEEDWKRHSYDDPDLPSPKWLFESPDAVMSSFERLRVVKNHDLKPHNVTPVEFGVTVSRQYQGNLPELKRDIENFRAQGVQGHIVCDNSGQVARLTELMEEIAGDFAIYVARLSGGFFDTHSRVAVFTDHEIFSRYRRRIKYRRYKDGVPIPDHRALTLGDFVVHIDYGIGRFMGLRRDTIGGAETDCLLIQYRDNDELLLPVGKLEKLKKFSAEEGVMPAVSKLGGATWEKLKERTKKSIQRIAGDLLRLYAERKTVKGFSFVMDEQLICSMEDSFDYEETPDQVKSWESVKEDMQNTSPMERLICGDVGFGKTEIAMRAAFFAVVNNKQVAVLVPTTILAEQHEKTFRERFADFPVTIDSLSRFRSTKEQKDVLDRLARGEVDILVGTHRLLSKDIHFKDLGLLVIDEEQRFGVRHKERLKNLRRNIDVLAMSATPIPRTLNMSMLGARDISYINTPPHDRYSVHTEIVPFDEKYVSEAIMREIDRDGQAFFVHNRVRSIESMAAYLKRLMPSVSFGVAHGQMPEKRLETVMHDFQARKYQVLVTTMIIENGLDMPSVNTIIINRADTFGLSQLYQLRGRVGRSSRRAFAYLMIPPKTTLTKTARQRLKTIEEFVGLGSGFNIAMRDLEIRGAGNILGTDQSGFISAIGFDMYMELLKETIMELRGGTLERPPEVDIHAECDAYIPEGYIPDATDRVVFYRRLSETLSAVEVASIEEELTDRFGRQPDTVRNLIDITYLKHYGASLNAVDLWIKGGSVMMYIPDSVDMGREAIENMVRKSPVRLDFSFEKGMKVKFVAPHIEGGKLEGVKNVLQVINA